MIEQGMEGRKINPDWVRPDLQEERGDIERVVVEFLGQESSPENINAVVRALESAPVVDLSDEKWKLLENTDSHVGNVRPGHIEDAEKINETHNLRLPPEQKRDFKKTLAGFISGSKMEMPTILRDKDGRLHLISGNTRLMISRALSIRPKVVIGTLEKFPKQILWENLIMEQVTHNPNFITPDLEYEKGEIERVSIEVFSEQDTEKFFLRFKESSKNAQLVDLSENMWSKLENTDSYEIPPNGWTQVEKHAVQGHPDHPRDWKFYKAQCEKRGTIKAPIVVKKANVLHLVSGNTRLMVARALGITPKVLLVEFQ